MEEVEKGPTSMHAGWLHGGVGLHRQLKLSEAKAEGRRSEAEGRRSEAEQEAEAEGNRSEAEGKLRPRGAGPRPSRKRKPRGVGPRPSRRRRPYKAEAESGMCMVGTHARSLWTHVHGVRAGWGLVMWQSGRGSRDRLPGVGGRGACMASCREVSGSGGRVWHRPRLLGAEADDAAVVESKTGSKRSASAEGESDSGPGTHAWPCRTHAWPRESGTSGTAGGAREPELELEPPVELGQRQEMGPGAERELRSNWRRPGCPEDGASREGAWELSGETWAMELKQRAFSMLL